MSLISKLKTLLGLGTEGSRRGHDVAVTEENDRVDEPPAAATDASASTESLVDDAVEEAEPESPADAAEPAEAAGPDETDMETDIEDVEPDAGDDVPDTEGAESVEIVSGVGPAYAERLADAGVETVAELAAADVADLADETGLSPKRIRRWVDDAADRLD